jgi:hypothetical protein
MIENEKYKKDINDFEEKFKSDTEIILLKKTIENEKKYQDEKEIIIKSFECELENTKTLLREIENEKIRLEEINNNNEINMKMKIEQSIYNVIKPEIEKKELILRENNELKDLVNQYRNDIYIKELAMEKLTNEILTKEMNDTKRNNVPANIGNDGEQIFENLARETFNDFVDSFEIENVSKNGGHQGDFILKFQNFNVIVDVKKYTRPVGASEREKLKRDLEKNPHIKIAWLVSLQTKVASFGKYPFMCEMVNGSCIFYVNSLLLKNDPIDTLKSLWCASETLFDIVLNKENDNMSLETMKKNEIRIYKICQDMIKLTKENKTTINQLKMSNENMENMIQDILKEGISNLRENVLDVIKMWCKSSICSSLNKKLNVSVIYEKFVEENPNHQNISIDSFRLYLKDIYDVKSKNFKTISNLDFINCNITLSEPVPFEYENII